MLAVITTEENHALPLKVGEENEVAASNTWHLQLSNTILPDMLNRERKEVVNRIHAIA